MATIEVVCSDSSACSLWESGLGTAAAGFAQDAQMLSAPPESSLLGNLALSVRHGHAPVGVRWPGSPSPLHVLT